MTIFATCATTATAARMRVNFLSRITCRQNHRSSSGGSSRNGFLGHGGRTMSTSTSSKVSEFGKWITVQKLDDDQTTKSGGSGSGVAKLIMNRPPANSLSMGKLKVWLDGYQINTYQRKPIQSIQDSFSVFISFSIWVFVSTYPTSFFLSFPSLIHGHTNLHRVPSRYVRCDHDIKE
jgi:hypothetical protein